MNSDYFKREEFACKCGCGFDTVDAELLEILESIREYFGKPVHINSACRCKEHNRNVGGGKRSQHLYGRAADIDVKDTAPEAVQAFFEAAYSERFGMGRYETFTHVDSRSTRARW